MTQFRLTKNHEGQFHFSLINEENKTLVRSEMYSSKASAINGIESVRTNAPQTQHYEYLTSKNNQSYFNIVAKNGQIVATSRMFETKAECEATAKIVQEQAAKAKVVEV